MFQRISTLCAALFAVLGLGFFMMPDAVTTVWGITLEGNAAFMGQRMSAGFFGFAVMLFLVRDAPPSHARRAVAFGVATAMVLVALVGFLGLAQGVVGPGILLAIAVELGIAVAFVITGRATG